MTQSVRTCFSRVVFAAALLLLSPIAAYAQTQRQGAGPELTAGSAWKSLLEKHNAYIGLMNRTLRAVDSWRRYTSWVNVKTGPTGRERYISYGLYTLYDVRRETDRVLKVMGEEPLMPDLDATVGRYVEAYEKLAPLIARAAAYYERQDYRDDQMAEGKRLHGELVPAATTFLKERESLEAQMQRLSASISERELGIIEATEGRSARWHIRDVMIEARRMLDAMPTSKAPIVRMAEFDKVLADYAASVRRLDEFNQANPGKIKFFDSQPRSLLSKLRDYRDRLVRAKGDGRRAGATNWIVFDYNSMLRSAETASRF